MLSSPAQAECVVEDDTTVCSGDISGGVFTNTERVVVSDVTTDVTPPTGVPAFWMPGLADADIDMGEHIVNVDGVPAIASLSPASDVELDFSGTINAYGANTADGGASGINIFGGNTADIDVIIRSVADITVNASRDPAVSPWGNVGINATGGSEGSGTVISAGDITLNVTGEPSAVVGLAADGGAGATVINQGNVTISSAGGFGAVILASSSGESFVSSTGNLSSDGSGIIADGAQVTVSSTGDISAVDGGIDAQADGDIEIISDGSVSTSGEGRHAIVASTSAGEILVDAQTITTSGENANGIDVQLGTGGATIDVDSITSTGHAVRLHGGGQGLGTATLNIAGAILSDSRAIEIATNSWTTVNVAEGASISGTTGIGKTSPSGAPFQGNVVVENNGTITGSSGTALALGQALANVTNSGTINGDIVAGPGIVQNRSGGTINGSVTLTAPAFQIISMFAYEGTETGVTGTITGSAAVDTFAQIFASDGTATIGGGLPTSFERYGVFSDPEAEDVTVIVEMAANPVDATPSLQLLGGASIINRANLADRVTGPGQVAAPALSNYVFGFVSRGPFGNGFTFEGGDSGPLSVTNEANIDGRVVLSTSAFSNSGSITRSSAGSPSIITALNGEAFTFSNSGSISMTDEGDRPRAPTNGNPFNDINPYYLPEPAVTIRSAISGTLDGDGLLIPVTIANTGEIDGGLLARMTASEFFFDNSGTITGFDGETRIEPALTILLGRNYDSAVGYTESGDIYYEPVGDIYYQPAPTVDSDLVTIVNSGIIEGGILTNLAAKNIVFSNSGTLRAGGVDDFGWGYDVDIYQNRLTPAGTEFRPDGETASITNTGIIETTFGADLSATEVTVFNSGSIVAGSAEESFERSTLSIENGTIGNHTMSFTNAAGGIIRSNAAGGYALEIESEAGAEPGEEDGLLPGAAIVTIVNAGSIAADAGGALLAPWEDGGPETVSLATALIGSTATVRSSDFSVTNEATGIISAAGDRSAAIVVDTNTFTLVNRGTITGTAGTTLGENQLFDQEFDGDEQAGFERTAIAGAIQTINSIDLVENFGTINGSIDLSFGADRLINRGAINGAVDLGAGDDILELSESSIISDAVDLGAGEDQVLLAFTADAGAGATGQVARTENAETLLVQSGNWRAGLGESVYNSVSIAQGATLAVAHNANGDIAISTPLVDLAGTLALDLATDTEAGELTGLQIVGQGTLRLVGEAVVLVDDASGLQYTGGTFVENGTLLLTDEFGGDISTSGDGVFELAEGGDFTGDLVNNGTFVFSQEGDYDFLGDFSGDGLLQKYGEGVLTFAGLYDFDGTTSVLGGSVTFTGQLSEDTELDLDGGTTDLSNISGGNQTIAGLSGQGGTLLLGNTNLNIQQPGNTVFGGAITGSGSLIKGGEGELDLTGDGTGFTGTGQVDGGTLSVNGNFSNAQFVVNQGGTLGGTGTVGNTNVNGGTMAPGNSIGTINVAGDITYTAASVFEVEVNAAGESDLVAATGTATLGGASVEVLAEEGTYRPITDYTILTADGGVNGEFGSVSTNFAFLDPSLAYSANAVTLRLVRNDIDFAAFGTTPNEVAIGNLLESFGFGDALYDETLMLADSDASPSFASLTGEVYPSYGSLLIESAEFVRRQTGSALPNAQGAFAWATGLLSAVGNYTLGGTSAGVAGGFGYATANFSASLGVGTIGQGNDGDVDDSDTTFAIGHLAYGGGAGVSIEAGAQFGWSDAAFTRRTTLGTLGSTLSGDGDGDYLQLFGELGYQLALGSVAVEPFAGISHVSLDLDQLSETGGATALDVDIAERDVTFGTLGLRVSGAEDAAVRPFASAAYRRAWGDRQGVANVAFAGRGATATITGARIARSAAELEAGVAFTAGVIDIEVGYSGMISDEFDSHGLDIGLRLQF